jgi:hypothetical protein
LKVSQIEDDAGGEKTIENCALMLKFVSTSD